MKKTTSIRLAFPTLLYQQGIWENAGAAQKAHRALLKYCQLLRSEDIAGQAWSKKNYPNGYTSYASVNDLHYRSPEFADLEIKIRRHVNSYAKKLHWNLQGRKLTITDCWLNVMEQNAVHTSHLHPHSVISGTYYLQVPNGASALKFEDPRLARMMASPLRNEDAPLEHRSFVSLSAQPGDVILFESWLKHEVPINRSRTPRISVSFNYDW